jgi:tetrahydromethanopterin S-methyltransferase subunit F
VALVAGGFAGLAAGLALAVFLVTWLKPVRVDDRALTT